MERESSAPDSARLRVLEGVDVDSYRSLIASTGWDELSGLSDRDVREALDRSWYVLSIVRDQTVVAVGRVVSDGRVYALIVDVVVHPDFRGLGLGSRIVDRLVERCASAAISDVLLFAAEGTSAFYERFGFERRPDDAPGMIRRS